MLRAHLGEPSKPWSQDALDHATHRDNHKVTAQNGLTTEGKAPESVTTCQEKRQSQSQGFLAD
jgi:hypothetical protein